MCDAKLHLDLKNKQTNTTLAAWLTMLTEKAATQSYFCPDC